MVRVEIEGQRDVIYKVDSGLMLQLLEDLPTIHPFGPIDLPVHPDVDHNPEGQSGQASKIPTMSTQQVADMQQERDILEEEVVDFDNGDLVRMKEKTRGMSRSRYLHITPADYVVITLSPLSTPSTELVSITLDVIVILDRIFILLRHRSQLLDLCQSRFQWEILRSQCFQDCARFLISIDNVLQDFLDWMPDAKMADVVVPSLPTEVDHPSNQPSVKVEDPLTPKQKQSRLIPASIYTPSPKSSPVKQASPGRQLLYLPLVRSRIGSLEIRHENLSMTTIPRLGAMLDRMIDVAAPLIASQSAEHKGAIPDHFLDAQDDMESRVLGLGTALIQCRNLEQWWIRRVTNV